ncbi:MAG: hypothetical protein QOC98_1326, partial [Frankiaceae bacterium]|nr:hypothetical protein [Frankiaceae bacterium]
PLTALSVLLAVVAGVGFSPLLTAVANASGPSDAIAVTTTDPPVAEGYFSLQPVGAILPDDDQCRGSVRYSSWEPRPENAKRNAANPDPNAVHAAFKARPRAVAGAYDPRWDSQLLPRVDGQFVGTTDEIFQWAACKWGLPDNLLRAVAHQESTWDQYLTYPTGRCVSSRGCGDFVPVPNSLTPDEAAASSAFCTALAGAGYDYQSDYGAGRCPETFSIVGIKSWQDPAWGSMPDNQNGTFPFNRDSTAFALDYLGSSLRGCYEGWETWLGGNNSGYGPGDLSGCVGSWYAGAWHSTDADNYAARVNTAENTQPWLAPDWPTNEPPCDAAYGCPGPDPITISAGTPTGRDIVSPSLSIWAPSYGSSVTGSVTLNGVASDDRGLQSVEVAVDDGSYQPAVVDAASAAPPNKQRPWHLTIDTSMLSNAAHTFHVRTADTSLNTAVQSDQLTVDNPAPTTAISCDSGPCSPGWYRGPVSLALTDAGGGSAGVTTVTTDGSDPTSSPTAWTYTGPFTVPSTETVEYFSRTGGGLAEPVHTQLIQVDTANPTLTIMCGSGTCDGTPHSSPLSLTLQAGDTGGSGLARTAYTTDGTDPTTSATAIPYVTPFTIAGSTTVRAASIDNAGNTTVATAQIPFSPIPGGLVLTPSDDSYTSRSNPDGSHGAERSVNVNGGSHERRTFLAFDVTGIPAGATSVQATLLLYAQSGAPTAVPFTLSQVNSSWREGSLTWNNQPQAGALIATRNGLTDGRMNSFDLSRLVQGNGRFAVVLTSSDTVQRYFSSKEATRPDERPQLTLRWSMPR